MKKLALALVFGALSVGAVSAQTVDKFKVKKEGKEIKTTQEYKGDKGRKHQAKSPAERADRTAKRMTEELGLNSNQANQVRELALVKAEQMQALKTKHGENRDAAKAEMKQIKTNFKNGLKSVLTAEQLQKHETLQAERRAKMKAKHGERKDHGKHKGQYKDKK